MLLLSMWNYSFFAVHYWASFWTVVCLGFVQILVAFSNSHLTIESLPMHITHTRRNRYRAIYAALMLGILCFTLLLARLNDSNQYQTQLALIQERAKQEALQGKLDQTLNAIKVSEAELDEIRNTVSDHPPDPTRTSMLHSLDRVEHNLATQEASMEGKKVSTALPSAGASSVQP
ncbi:hypothetical protein [Granulicella mallensis]|uniref:Uncharacterized protein n=1 Tax=Granulicella mallensis TaxID=940614 RepID=A0A7W7ZWC7_9BACT|nr:hypothetical protein [Granulicella mallensis]MBB5066476.1 hypothetical protein [Granulicella mallensis]